MNEIKIETLEDLEAIKGGLAFGGRVTDEDEE